MINRDNDLEKVDAEMQAAERRRQWMSGVVSSLKARNHHARVAERQLEDFARMLTAMRTRRREIEDAILAERALAIATSAASSVSQDMQIPDSQP